MQFFSEMTRTKRDLPIWLEGEGFAMGYYPDRRQKSMNKRCSDDSTVFSLYGIDSMSLKCSMSLK